MIKMLIPATLAVLVGASGAAMGGSTPPVPIEGGLTCGNFRFDDMETDNPLLVIRNDCSEDIAWTMCLRYEDESEPVYYEGGLQPGAEAVVETVAGRHLGVQYTVIIYAQYYGVEMPWPEC